MLCGDATLIVGIQNDVRRNCATERGPVNNQDFTVFQYGEVEKIPLLEDIEDSILLPPCALIETTRDPR
jgi:hypothetical protein